MDEEKIITEPIKKVIEEAAETAREFAGKLINPALEEGGGVLSDTIKFWRFKNQINLLLKAKKFLEDKGINPSQVLPKTLVPILEEGSLEEDAMMQNRWAAMLANAADPSSGVDVRPSYPEILKQLSALEVAILDSFYTTINAMTDSDRDQQMLMKIKIEQVFGISGNECEIIINNFLRLGLCAMPSSKGGVSIGNTPLALHTYDYVKLTALGNDFIKACKYT